MWFRHNQKIMLEIDGTHERGHLQLTMNGTWAFVTLDKRGSIHISHPLPNLGFDWFDRVDSQTLILGWQDISHFLGTAGHVSAALYKRTCPSSLSQALDPRHPDHLMWLVSYKEECDGFREFDTFEELTLQEYRKLAETHGPAIPSMCVLVTKKDEHGNPVRVKSRIVVLGDKDPHQWSKGNCFAPVAAQSAVCLLVSLAIEHSKFAQQGDCKNSFCNPVLPEDEVVIVPPPGCPLSKPNTFWRLRKTLYGLRRPPKHWYEMFKSVVKICGLQPCPNSPCLFYGHPIPGKAPLYIAVYVDDFIYFSPDESVERHFETKMQAKLRVDFFGTVEWFLGTYYDWSREDGHASVHLSQEAYSRQLISSHNMANATSADTPYRSGHTIDDIPETTLDTLEQDIITAKYQTLIGSLLWLAYTTRPDICVATSLLAQYNKQLSSGHYDAALYVLKCLSGTSDHGLRFAHKTNTTLINFIGFDPAQDATFCDAN
jgi:hypothetical protein